MAAAAPDSEGVFARLKAGCDADWAAYTRHAFVTGLADGSLPEACFRWYLAQDYLFLIHFARAYALAAFKSDSLEDIRQASATLDALINAEMRLHVTYCGTWGLTESDMAALPEAPQNMAYTRFVLERGLAGDLLDLLVALAPCVLGYGEIGRRLHADPATRLEGNPYRDWIEMYGGRDYQEVAAGSRGQLDRVAKARLGPDPAASPRWPALAETFGGATRLEVGFWDMGLAPPAAFGGA